ncbi:hypothetical protein CHUAL_013325 [Chamberlinius hualienensis]
MVSAFFGKRWAGNLRFLSLSTIADGKINFTLNFLSSNSYMRHVLRSCVRTKGLSVESRRQYSTKSPEGDHVNFDTLGTWDNRIELPLLMTQSIKRGKPIPKISVTNIGHATNVGRRTSNEDRYSIKEIFPELLYFAVFDGHGGSACAEFCNRHTEEHIRSWLTKGETDLKVILESVFQELNNSFARMVAFDQEGASSGTTATVCLLRNSIELVVGHVGDSRVILCRNGEARKLTIDHCPSIKTEKERIEKSGGHIVCNSIGQLLVNGRLAMTRSLGDLELKQFGVLSMPDTRSLEVKHGKDAFMILTTDGINFVMSDQEICDAVNRCQDPSEAANFVVDQALQYASDDNATALVIPLGSWGKFGANTSHYSFGRNMIRSARFS